MATSELRAPLNKDHFPAATNLLAQCIAVLEKKTMEILCNSAVGSPFRGPIVQWSLLLGSPSYKIPLYSGPSCEAILYSSPSYDATLYSTVVPLF